MVNSRINQPWRSTMNPNLPFGWYQRTAHPKKRCYFGFLTLPSISQHQVCGGVPFKGWTSMSLRGPLPKTLVFYQLNYSFSCFAALVHLHNQQKCNSGKLHWHNMIFYRSVNWDVSWSSPIMVQLALSAVLPPFTWISLTCAFFWPITLPTWRWDFPMFGWREWEYNLWLQDRTCQSGYMYITI